MKKTYFIFLCLLLVITFYSCEGVNNGDDKSADFELAGTWFAENVNVNVSSDTYADITTTFTDTSFTTSTVIGSDTYESSGIMVSYSNEEDWYIAQITEGAGSQNGMYGRTEYVLADDGLSFTATSYSYEDTEEAAKASTTPQIQNISAVKQQ